MDLNALFKIPYGLYMAGVENAGKLSGCIINTASQITAEPPRIVVTMLKSNFTSSQIVAKQSLSVSVLARDCPLDVVTGFGYRSSREADKFADFPHAMDSFGNPYLTAHTAAVFEARVERTMDVDTHWLFLCALTDARTTGVQSALTYEDYRILKAGGSLAAGAQPAQAPKKYVCSVCHYVYEGETPFEELPEDYICPICKRPKSVFVLQ